MKIAIVSRADVADVRILSGFPYFMAQALGKHVGEVEYLPPDFSLGTKLIDRGERILDRASFLLARRHLAAGHNRLLAWRLAQVFGSHLSRSRFDVIFAPVASVEIAQLDTEIPIIYATDQNWADAVDYYAGTSALWGFAHREADAIDTAALHKAAAILYPSKWPAKSAEQHYGILAEKINVIPWGANFTPDNLPAAEVAVRHPLGDEIVLLWVGVDWERKGGAIAHACLMSLLEKGITARLVICGCAPPAQFLHPQVSIIPFLNKRDPEQRARLSQLFLNAHFFVFPTQAEAYGLVLCEASAHGLPSLVRETGGTVGAIKNGENGYLIALDAAGEDYAEKILSILETPGQYEALVQSSRRYFEMHLNWDAWGRAVKPVFELVLEQRNVRRQSAQNRLNTIAVTRAGTETPQ